MIPQYYNDIVIKAVDGNKIIVQAQVYNFDTQEANEQQKAISIKINKEDIIKICAQFIGNYLNFNLLAEKGHHPTKKTIKKGITPINSFIIMSINSEIMAKLVVPLNLITEKDINKIIKYIEDEKKPIIKTQHNIL